MRSVFIIMLLIAAFGIGWNLAIMETGGDDGRGSEAPDIVFP